MPGGTDAVQFSVGHTVDNKGTSPLENPIGLTGWVCRSLSWCVCHWHAYLDCFMSPGVFLDSYLGKQTTWSEKESSEFVVSFLLWGLVKNFTYQPLLLLIFILYFLSCAVHVMARFSLWECLFQIIQRFIQMLWQMFGSVSSGTSL